MGARPGKEQAVIVPGGELAVTRWTATGQRAGALLAVHGITANGLNWSKIADELSEFDVIAPDLRGRAHSSVVAGPYGLSRHADDLITVLDDLKIEGPVVLAGHSMGAFVSCVAATKHPERFAGVVLVDGGFGLRPPAGADLDEILITMLGPAMRRLDMRFASAAEYRQFWREHPAFGGLWDTDIEAYVDRDLVGEPPMLRSSCVAEAVRTDGADVLRDGQVTSVIRRLTQPTTFLLAERGMFDQPPGLYTKDVVDVAGLPGHVDVRMVPDTNHYSILIGAPGRAAVVSAIRERLFTA